MGYGLIFFNRANRAVLPLLAVTCAGLISARADLRRDVFPTPAAEGQPVPGYWEQLKGRPARDALLLGMWSLHLDGSGEFFGSGRNNDHIHLLGAYYRGYAVGTFVNSHYQRTFFAGLAREVGSVPKAGNMRIDVGYNIGLLYGYGDNLYNIHGISGMLRTTLGLTWHRVGIDIGYVPLSVATLSFRVDL